MIVISTDTVVVCIGTKRDCQCHRYLLLKLIFLRVPYGRLWVGMDYVTINFVRLYLVYGYVWRLKMFVHIRLE